MNKEKATQLHRESIVIDGLNASYFYNETVRQRLHASGITAVNTTIAAWHGPAETVALIGDCLHLFEQHSDLIVQVHATADIHAAKESNRTGLILGFQDTAPIADNLRLLSVYHKLGVRIIQLTYNYENRVGNGCRVSDDTGLTAFGREVVAEMNRLGLLIDLSHCGPQTTLDAIEASQQPVAVTHANARSQFDHPRNKTDAAIQAVAAQGGVIGALSFPAMLTQRLPATLDDYLATIDYLVNMVGIDHVGLGPDFMEEMPLEIARQVLKGLPPKAIDQFTSMPPVQDFETAAAMPNVTQGLLARGYSTDDVHKLMGGNWLRLYWEVWQT